MGLLGKTEYPAKSSLKLTNHARSNIVRCATMTLVSRPTLVSISMQKYHITAN